MAIDKNEKSLGSLFTDLTRETVDLVRQEIALARAEISQKISTAQTGLISVAVGAAVLLAGVFVLLQALVGVVAMLVPENMAPWLAPLIVGLIISVIGYMLLKGGTEKLQPENLIPHRTVDSLIKDKNVAKEKMQ